MKKTTDFTIAGVSVALGESKKIEMPIGRLYTDNIVSMPVYVKRSKRPGPTLFNSAAIHGDELNGIEIIQRLINSRSLNSLRGTLIAAVQVSSAAQETQATAMHLAEASEHQAQEIAGASAAINEMAVSIDQVSANASESSAVAERSVAIANKGAEVVQATIHGMDNLREQIQETSKRIKRLGESSQEIGDIISLITDIADQTNILSLNAAIQASMAGDAGR